MAKSKKTRAPKVVDPIFAPGTYLGAFGAKQLLTDSNGHVWWIDLDTGKARPIEFVGRGR